MVISEKGKDNCTEKDYVDTSSLKKIRGLKYVFF